MTFGLLCNGAAMAQPSNVGGASLTCSIEGTVVQAKSGSPIAGADVTIYPRDGLEGPPLVVSSDAKGRFLALDLPCGKYSVSATAAAFIGIDYGQLGAGTAPVLLLTGGEATKGVDFRLVASGVISGSVFGQEGEPRVGGEVRALKASYGPAGRRFVMAGRSSTDDRGAYRIYGIAPGQYYLSFRGPDPASYRTVRRPKDAPPDERYIPTYYPSGDALTDAVSVNVSDGEETSGIDIVARRSKAFHIRGSLSAGCTVSGVQLEIEGSGTGGYHGGEVGLGPGRQFDFQGAVPGSYIVHTAGSNMGKYCSAIREVDVVDGDIDGVILAPTSGIDLQGHVRIEGTTTLDFTRLAVLLDPQSFTTRGWPPARVDPSGAFVVHGLEPSDYRVELLGLPPDFYVKGISLGTKAVADYLADFRYTATPESLDILISPNGARIGGVVKDDSGNAVSESLVALVPDVTRRQLKYLFKETRADKNGVFSFHGVQPGEYKVFAWRNIESWSYEDPSVLMPYESKGEVVSLEEGGRMTFEVRVIAPTAP